MQIDRYNVVDDFGVVLNPMLVEGQVHGGIVQGIGQALLEGAVYDDSGQLLTGSFMDYSMPRADNMPIVRLLDGRGAVQEQRDGRQGLRRGRLGRLAGRGDQRARRRARDLGVTHVDMPATALKLWDLIHTKKAA